MGRREFVLWFMLFTGWYELRIDAKHRLSIPASIRAEIERDAAGSILYVTPGRPSNTLWLYTESMFQRVAEQLGSGLLRHDDLLDFEQRFFPSSRRLEIDPQGRVLLPETMVRAAELGREVVVCGVRDHLEIRRLDEWQQQSRTDWQRFPELQVKARQAIEQIRRQSGDAG